MMRLRDGTEAVIRPIRPEDKERLLNAFRRLEAQSVYARFFHAKTHLSDEELRRLTELDPAKEAALVVTTGSAAAERIIAVGRYVASGDRAEVAFTVEEDYQRMGLAGRLLRELARIARAKGIARFDAYVLKENTAMLAVFERSGFPLTSKYEDGSLRLTLELG